MSDRDAYLDEMRFLRELSDRDVEGLLSRRSGGESENEDVAAFLRDLRDVYTEAPSGPTEVTHVAAIARAARALADGHEELTPPHRSSIQGAKQTNRRGTMTKKRLALLTAGLALAAPLSMAGLATAGVTLPDAARAPFDQLGVELPNQATSDDVHAVIDSTPPDQRDCSFGQEVAQAANGGKGGPGEDPCAQANDGAPDSGNSDNEHADIGRSFGEQTSTDAQDNASQDGQAFGERTSQGAQELGEQQSQAAQETGVDQSQAGQETAAEQSQAGQQTASQASGGQAP
jgi:hypothetical protein